MCIPRLAWPIGQWIWVNEGVTTRIRIKKGLDIPIAGEPQQSIHPGAPVRQVALCGPDYPGLRPRLLVKKGDAVGAGQPLFIDKRDPAVPYCSPGQGIVASINRGARRVLETVVVRLGDSPVADKRYLFYLEVLQCFDPVIVSSDELLTRRSH